MSDQVKLSKILVAVDGSDESLKAADYAISLAKSQNAHLDTISIFKILDTKSMFESDKMYEEFFKKQMKIYEDCLALVKTKADKNNVPVEPRLIETGSSIAEEIISFADKNNADLIVVGSRGISGFKRLLLGSVASAVVTHSSCPVLVIR